MTASIPLRVREMTPDWLNEVYAEVGIVATIESLDIEQINIGTGFAGRVLRLRPRYEGSSEGAPESLIVKTPSPDPAVRGLLDELRGYELESLFYAELVKRTPTPVPHCIWNGADPEQGQFVLLLEDLVGYEPGGQTADEVDVELVTAVVRELGRLHSAWWNDDALRAHSGIPASDGPERLVWQRTALAGLPEWERSFSGRVEQRTIEGVGTALTRLAELSRTAADGAYTLVHGDYRLDNMMYRGGADRPLVVLDWQLLHRGSGAYDLAYLLGQSVPTETRRAHGEEWLALYLEELAVPGYSAARLRRDFAIGLLQSMIVPTTAAGIAATAAVQIAEMPEGPVLGAYRATLAASLQLTSLMTERCTTAIEDHDALHVLD